jgi:hypothetical protein
MVKSDKGWGPHQPEDGQFEPIISGAMFCKRIMQAWLLFVLLFASHAGKKSAPLFPDLCYRLTHPQFPRFHNLTKDFPSASSKYSAHSANVDKLRVHHTS